MSESEVPEKVTEAPKQEVKEEKKVSIKDFMKFELRVAEILDVEQHPDADRLYVLKIKVGEEQKQIVAGVKAFYGDEELRGKKIIVVNNLKPAKLRGVESQGMLLAASTEDREKLCLVIPEQDDMPDGAKVG